MFQTGTTSDTIVVKWAQPEYFSLSFVELRRLPEDAFVISLIDFEMGNDIYAEPHATLTEGTEYYFLAFGRNRYSGTDRANSETLKGYLGLL